MEDVLIGKVYRHFKGNYYFVENLGLDSESKEKLVIYKALYERPDSKIWVRRESDFLSKIDETRKDNITGQKYRFEIVDDIGKDYTK